MERMGIDQLEVLVRAAAKFGSAAGEVYEDGRLTISDMNELWSLAGSVQDLAMLDFKEAIPQSKDLDAMEVEILCEILTKEFDIPQDKLEAKLEGYMLRGKNLFIAIRELIDFHQEGREEA